MLDPVVLEDGVTYERVAIQTHLLGSPISPSTQQVVRAPSALWPNLALRALIRAELERNFEATHQSAMQRTMSVPDPRPCWVMRQEGTRTVPVLGPVALSEDAEDFAAVRQLAATRLRSASDAVEVVRVARLQNDRQWARFAEYRQGVLRTRGAAGVNEQYVFHAAASIRDYDGIAFSGFDLSRALGGPCGFGVYSSDSLEYGLVFCFFHLARCI
jgi:hypothetical protein